MKECGIFRGEVRTYFDPSYLFSGVKTPSTTVDPWEQHATSDVHVHSVQVLVQCFA